MAKVVRAGRSGVGMSEFVQPEIAAALEVARRNARRSASRHTIVAGERQHRVIEFSHDGFVIEADGRPPLRGYVDLFMGDERISRRLVVCAWAEDGLVGYEFKRTSPDKESTPADYVVPGHAGLLAAPKP